MKEKVEHKDTWTAKGHSIVCPKHGPLVDTKRHCHNLARFFISENPYDSTPIASWFQIASGIMEVKYVSDLYDDYVQWCGTAIEYENAKSEFHSKLIRELTRFNFIWGGFEAYYDSISIFPCPDSKKRGIVNSVNYFLKSTYLPNFPKPLFYDEVINHLKKLISLNKWYGNVYELFSEDNCTTDEIAGLKAVYKIRNLFAHGAFEFSEPDGWNAVKPFDIGIINTSSRILILTLQMLLLSYKSNLKFKVTELHDAEENGVNASIFLKKMHLKSFRYS